jgi:hypothetical protein
MSKNLKILKNPESSKKFKIIFFSFCNKPTSYLLLKSKIANFFCWFLRFGERFLQKNYFFNLFITRKIYKKVLKNSLIKFRKSLVEIREGRSKNENVLNGAILD